jgi:glycine betaine/proline transport system substrate-binding protein
VAPQLFAAESLDDLPLGESNIEVGLTNYADEYATDAVVNTLLERIGYQIKSDKVDIGIWFAGVAGGSIDVAFNGWLETSHRDYWKRYKDQLLDLDVVYEPTTQGWAVPSYVPKKQLDSIADLKKPEVRDKLGGKITGISAGAGLMKDSAKVMKAYNLSKAGYVVQPSSAAVMTAALGRAIQHHDWIVVTAWSPHWMWQRFKLRYLNEPKGIFGEKGKVHAISGKDFPKRFPRAAAFIRNFQMPATAVEKIMNGANKILSNDNGKDIKKAYAKAADKYLQDHPKLVQKALHPNLKHVTQRSSDNTGQ